MTTEPKMTHIRYPDPGQYASLWAHVRQLADDSRVPDFVDASRGTVTGRELKAKFRRALHNRINTRGSLCMAGRRYDGLYQADLYRDQRALHDKLQKRVRVYQFLTDIVRRRFGYLLDSREE